MNDKQLEIFLAAARCGSFAKAEKELYLSRQAIMKHIDRLEAEIGAPLFTRTPAGLTLTHTGTVFRAGLLPIREQMQALLTLCRNDEGSRRLTVEIPRHPHSLLDQAIALFSKRHPQIKLEIVREVSSGRPDRLRSGKIDVAEIPFRETLDLSGLAYQRLVDNAFFCLVAQEHPLASQGYVNPADLESCQVYVNSLSGRRKLIDALHAQVPGIVFHELSGEERDAIPNVCYNNGVYITPAYFAARMEYMSAIPLRTDIRQEIGLICRAQHSEAVDLFIGVVRETIPTLE